MLKEFKEFISRGNVIDLAVGVVVGGAFTAIVNSLVNDILMPIIGAITAGLNFTDITFKIAGVDIMIGSFIQNVIYFLIVAWVIFLVVKAMNKLRSVNPLRKEEAPKEEAK